MAENIVSPATIHPEFDSGNPDEQLSLQAEAEKLVLLASELPDPVKDLPQLVQSRNFTEIRAALVRARSILEQVKNKRVQIMEKKGRRVRHIENLLNLAAAKPEFFVQKCGELLKAAALELPILQERRLRGIETLIPEIDMLFTRYDTMDMSEENILKNAQQILEDYERISAIESQMNTLTETEWAKYSDTRSKMEKIFRKLANASSFIDEGDSVVAD